MNYLVRSKTGNIVLGPMYFETNHPLHANYLAFLQEMEGHKNSPLGMSIGALRSIYNLPPESK